MTTKNKRLNKSKRQLAKIIALATASNNATNLANAAHWASLQARWDVRGDSAYRAAVTVYQEARAAADAAYTAWNTAYYASFAQGRAPVKRVVPLRDVAAT